MLMYVQEAMFLRLKLLDRTQGKATYWSLGNPNSERKDEGYNHSQKTKSSISFATV